MKPRVNRTITIVAGAVLAFDGVALAAAGLWSGRILLALIGMVFFVSSGLVLFYWRWYCRRLDQISEARKALADDAREMRRMVREPGGER